MAIHNTRKRSRATLRKAAGASHPASLAFTLAGIAPESVKLASSTFPTLSVGKARILAALALCGNNAPHRKVATVAGAFHRGATPKGCARCRASLGKAYAGRCAGNDGVTRWTVSIVGEALRVAPNGSRADRVTNLWASWMMGLAPKARAAEWARIGTLRT